MHKRLFGILFLFFCNSIIFSQQKNLNNAPLKEVLLLLEKKHQVKFSFSDDLVSSKKVSILMRESDSITYVIKKLEKQALISFNKVTERYYTITAIEKIDVCGYIKDIITMEPLVGATIFNTKRNKAAITDENGFFELKDVQISDYVNISYVGYASKNVSVVRAFKADKCLRVNLRTSTSLLSEVLVENYLTSGVNKKNDGALVIQPQKLGILPGLVEPDILQSLQLIPGIQSPNETVSGLHIRGGTPDHNLILFDGIKIYNSAHFFGMISAFNPYITKSIKVYKGASRAQYGNHTSGVIDIETDSDIPENLEGGFGTNLTHADAYLKIPISKKLGANVSIRRSFTDFINTPTIDKITKKVFQNTIIESNKENPSSLVENDETFYFLDHNIKLNYKASEKDFLSINQLETKNKLDYLFNYDRGNFVTRDILNIQNYGVNLKWVRNWSDKIEQKTNLFYSNYDLDYNYNGEVKVGRPYTESSVKKNSIKSVGFNTSIGFQLNKKSSLHLGYNYVNNEVGYELGRTYSTLPQLDYLINQVGHDNNHAFYLEYLFRNDIFSFNFGNRITHFSRANKVFYSPRLYWEAMLSDELYLKSSFEHKQQNISQLLEFTTSDFGLENQVWLLSNENFPILKSSQFSLGFTYRENRWTIDFDYYNKTITGLTSFVSGFNNVQEEFSNGRSDISGIDLLIKKSWRHYSSWLSYGYQSNEFVFENIDNGRPFPGNFDSTHNINWTHNLKLGNFDFSLGWNYKTGIPFTEALGINQNLSINFDAKNSKRLESYERIDFSSTYSFYFSKNQKWKGKIGISLLNIFDQENVLNRDHSVLFNFNTSNNTFFPSINTIDNVSQGFTPNFVFRVDF
ncbi:putative TonB-dependent outer membrane receptor [Tenacibaculum sp. 190130A14a]|uniref:TonB-dependent outer membrane receptor n=1 Tax=Tenacibaculum polynesiense TaxID=3137857 RepID=A0ABP1F419_9FLAO